MFKKEIIWRELLFQSIEKNQWKFTQQNLARQFSFSLSTISHALAVPRQVGCIKVYSRYFLVQEIEKFLALWATTRNLAADIVYRTTVQASPLQMESQMPPDTIFTAYSGYRFRFNEAPADYDKVVVYSSNVMAMQQRFPPISKQQSYFNLIVLKQDAWLQQYGNQPPLAQLYVDLWNMTDWHAKEFLLALRQKMNI